MRVFHDRLTTDKDREEIKSLLFNYIEKMGFKKDEIYNAERILFVDFLGGRD
jgi:dynein heavy chain